MLLRLELHPIVSVALGRTQELEARVERRLEVGCTWNMVAAGEERHIQVEGMARRMRELRIVLEAEHRTVVVEARHMVAEAELHMAVEEGQRMVVVGEHHRAVVHRSLVEDSLAEEVRRMAAEEDSLVEGEDIVHSLAAGILRVRKSAFVQRTSMHWEERSLRPGGGAPYGGW